jgi:1,6-anhydro-N-acetylmuramate kinase
VRILAFALTTAAHVAGAKTVTCRTWSDEYAGRIIAEIEAAKAGGERGIRMQGWNNSSRVKGARRLSTVLVTEVAKWRTADLPDSDWEAEGFAWMDANGLLVGKERR